MIVSSAHSFRLLSKEKPVRIPIDKSPLVEQKNVELESDSKKRSFLKFAGMVGAGAIAASLLPKNTAEALVFGSTPTSNVVGIRDSSNAKVNPATIGKQDEILNELKLKADLTETQPVSVAGTVNVAVSGTPTVSGVVGLSDIANVRITPAQDDSVTLLRRLVKLMESQAVVDNQMRQRIVVDAGTITTVSTVTAVTTLTTINQIAGVDSRWQILDWSRQAYNSGIRGNLSW